METIYKEVVTRKVHSCCGCCKAIPKRTKAFYLTTFSNGKITHGYLCKVCDAVAHDPCGFDDEDFFEGEIKSEFPELWEQYKEMLKNV